MLGEVSPGTRLGCLIGARFRQRHDYIVWYRRDFARGEVFVRQYERAFTEDEVSSVNGARFRQGRNCVVGYGRDFARDEIMLFEYGRDFAKDAIILFDRGETSPATRFSSASMGER